MPNNRGRGRKYYNDRYRNKKRLRINQLLGSKCAICGYTYTYSSDNRKRLHERLFCHEIHGRKHSKNMCYIIEHPEDFIKLCYECHQFLHHLAIITNTPIENLLVKFKVLIYIHTKLKRFIEWLVRLGL